jgi:putative addiction module component (TIGR02574 family)
MTTTLHGIATEALKLPNNEREALIETLVASVVPPSPLHPEWEAEIARRLDDIETGRVTLIPGEHVFAEVRALIAGHKRRTLEA